MLESIKEAESSNFDVSNIESNVSKIEENIRVS